ncbi:MAG: hypothetical protein HC921_11310 [Synechococcaceae cyanobacterium SM2_3_1]|nr:hypothetical protein [Synechococcaceae cyanobacterium SM2_3_1]
MESFDPAKLFVQMAASLMVGLVALSLLSLADQQWSSTVDLDEASIVSPQSLSRR